jgi:L-malate glycosyltransferase
MKKKILLVPGFVVDTYSEIEASFVELAATPSATVEFLWLVPTIRSPANRFARPESRAQLHEPIWVEHLRRHRIPYVVGDIHPFGVLHNLRLFRRLFRAHRVDAVYTHFGIERFWATVFAKLSGKTTIWNEHWHSLGTKYTPAKRAFYRLFVDAFISVSGFIADTLPRGTRVHTIHNAIRTEKHAPLAEARPMLRARLGLPGSAPVVMMVAEFRADKRHSLALPICLAVARRHPQTVFVFLGEGATRREFLRQATAQGLTNVVSPGHVDNVNEYYAAADVCILTSRNEPFGYCVLEAMKFAVPMVTFNSGGPAEIIKNEHTGMLVAEGDVAGFAARVSALLDDPSLRAKMGEKARDAVQREFSRDVWTQRVMAALSDIMRAPEPRAASASLGRG